MNLLLSIVRNIALLVLISSFWELLVPGGSLRGPVRLVIGLLLVACVVQPLSDALARGPTPWELEIAEPEAPFGVEAAIAQGQELAGAMQEQAQSQYEADMARQVASIALLCEGVQSARARVSAAPESGALNHITILAELSDSADAAATQSKLSGLISTFFAIGEANIDCQIKEVE